MANNEYKLFSWYPWGFGKWQYIGTFGTMKDTMRCVTANRFGCYAIVKSRVIIKYENLIQYRYGMVSPSLPINHNGERYFKK